VFLIPGISLIGDEDALILNEAGSLELLSDEELVVEIFDLKDEGRSNLVLLFIKKECYFILSYSKELEFYYGKVLTILFLWTYLKTF